jgi:16S rRNA (adenine1518-N6/adenine1519-N6)-dimethyltransferase
VVYEIDPILCQVLADLLVPVARRCFVHCADFLTACPEQAGATDKWVLVGNLPYSLTTPILERIFFGRLRWRSVIVMVQREFADRLLASPGTRTYGSLTLFAQLHCQHIERVMELSPGSFWPQPKVSSAALQLTLRRQLPAFVVNPQYVSEVIRGAFNYRRKTLLRALTTAAPLGASAEQVRTAIEDAGLDPSHRPENLTLEDFAALAASLQRVTGSLG